MSHQVFNLPQQLNISSNLRLMGGAKALFQLSGSTTNTPVYTTAALNVAHPNPVEADSAGLLPVIYLNPTIRYRVTLMTSADIVLPLYPKDDVNDQILSGDILNTYLPLTNPYKRTTAEIAAGITPIDYSYPSHDNCGGVIPNRYQVNTTPGTTLMTPGFTAAKAVSQAAVAPILMLAQTYVAHVSFRYNNAGIVGPGSAFCTIKQPPGALTPGGVIEVGDTASGGAGAQYTGFIAHGFTIDGNATNTTPPAGDITGHGMILTDIQYWSITDVTAQNTHLGGIIPVIRSNYGHLDVKVINCGHGGSTWPGFDINSSQSITGRVISKGCYSGARVLDNCWKCVIDFSIESPTTIGWIYNNQSVNECHSNIFRVTVDNAGTDGGQIGGDCRNSIIEFTSNDATNYGFRSVFQAIATDRQSGNTFVINTRNSGGSSCEIGGDGENWTINSFGDALVGAPSLLEITGQNNNIVFNATGASLTATVSAATNANPCAITTSAAHLMSTGGLVKFSGVGGMTQLNTGIYSLTVTSPTSFTLDGVDSTAYGAFTSGGTAIKVTRGISLTATSVGNKLIAYTRNSLVSGYDDLGAGNTFAPVIYHGSKTYDTPSILAVGQTSTTVTVTGAALGVGDYATAWFSIDIAGVTVQALVTATDTVTVWITNSTAGTVDLPSATLYAAVTKRTP